MNLHERELDLIQRLRQVSFTDEGLVTEFYSKLYEFLDESERLLVMCQEYDDRHEAETYLQDCAYETDILSALSL